MSSINLICVNGSYFSEDMLFFNEQNRSFRYGDGLFETMLWTGSGIRFLNEHFIRLREGMDLLGIQANEKFEDLIVQSISNLIRLNGITAMARLRLTVYRSGAGAYLPEQNTAHWIISTAHIHMQEIKSDLPQLIFFDKIKKPVNALSSIKSANALLYILAMKQAQEQNADEAIILNERDEVCEAASCNLFIVKDEQIFTPGLESGCLDGVFRKKLIHYLRQHYPEQIIILPMSREALLEADEIWLTNAVQGLKRYFLNPNTKGSSSSILQAIQEALMNDATFLEQEN